MLSRRSIWCYFGLMTRITVDVNDEWLEAAREELGTRRAVDIVGAFDGVEMDFTDSPDAWRYGGGRDLSRLEEDARQAKSA